MKFAYLIMAHNKFNVLKLLLEDLDDEKNDIFLHVDKKTKDFKEKDIEGIVHKAKLILVERMSVYWGDFSQIQCIVKLLNEAVGYGYHDYYHLVAGVEFPLKSQQEIHRFFEENNGKEFIGFSAYNSVFTERVKYYYFFRKYARYRNLWERLLGGLGSYLIPLQKKMGVNRIKDCSLEFRKGYANWSITHNLAVYVLKNDKEIVKRYRYTFCADEVFLHTLVFNSGFYDRVYDLEDEYHSAMSLNTWEDPKNQYHLKDLEMLLQSGRLFAKKIDGEDAEELILQIKNNRK